MCSRQSRDEESQRTFNPLPTSFALEMEDHSLKPSFQETCRGSEMILRQIDRLRMERMQTDLLIDSKCQIITSHTNLNVQQSRAHRHPNYVRLHSAPRSCSQSLLLKDNHYQACRSFEQLKALDWVSANIRRKIKSVAQISGIRRMHERLLQRSKEK